MLYLTEHTENKVKISEDIYKKMKSSIKDYNTKTGLNKQLKAHLYYYSENCLEMVICQYNK